MQANSATQQTGPPPLPASTAPCQVVLTGNPNCGKTTLFNALTGLRAKVGNYPGVTVERKEGRLQGTSKDDPVIVLDLPGTYSLSPQSRDEQISRDALFHRLPEVPPPDVVVVVVDASNLQRNLYFATQVLELGYPTLIALNMIDVAAQQGHEIDSVRLSHELGVPVLPIIASTGQGVPVLRERLNLIANGKQKAVPSSLVCEVPQALRLATEDLARELRVAFPGSRFRNVAEALLVLSDEKFLLSSGAHYPLKIREAVASARVPLEKAGLDWRTAAIESRYARIARIEEAATRSTDN